MEKIIKVEINTAKYYTFPENTGRFLPEKLYKVRYVQTLTGEGGKTTYFDVLDEDGKLIKVGHGEIIQVFE